MRRDAAGWRSTSSGSPSGSPCCSSGRRAGCSPSAPSRRPCSRCEASSAPWWILPVAGCGAPLVAVGVRSPLPSASMCSGEVTVTSLIWPSVCLPAVTVPLEETLTSLGATPGGSLIGGVRRLPSALTSVPLASTPKLPLRVSACCPLARVDLEVAGAFDRQVEGVAGFGDRTLRFAAADNRGVRAGAGGGDRCRPC